MIRVDVLDPRRDPEPPYWQELRAHAGLRANWHYPAIRAAALTGRVPQLVAVARRGPDVLGVLSAYLSGLPLRRARYAPVSGLRQFGVLDVKAPHSTSQRGWWFAPRPPAEAAGAAGVAEVAEVAEVARGCVRALRAVVGRRACAVLWRHARAEDLRWLAARPALVRPSPPTAVLDLPTGRFEDWLARLRRGRRQDLRRQFRAVADDPDLTVRHGPPAEVLDPVEFARLLAATAAKHGGGPVSVAWLAAVFQAPDVTALVYRDHAGGARAALLLLDHPRRPTVYLWGALDGVRDVYFDMYGRIVRWATESGKDGLVLGGGMVDLKVTLGARAVPEHVVLTGR